MRRPSSDEDLAFLPVTHLARLVESRQVTPTELTTLYLARLKKHDPQLHCVVTLTEDLALRQATQADEEIASGTYRGSLHGIPWGLKDLLAVRGIRTTWGMSPFRDPVIDTDATVYSRLTQAGAILVADGKDNTVFDVPFNWDASSDVTGLRVGYMSPTTDGAIDDQTRRNDENALRVIRSLGVTLVPFALPEVPIEAIDFIRYAETAAAFDEVTGPAF